MDDGVRRTPALAAGGDVVLLLRNQVVVFRTRCRVGGHVEDALRVVQDALFHVGNGVAEVLRFVVVLEFFVLQCVIQELMRLALLAFLQVVERSMLFAVARELIRTGIGVVMALEDDVNLVSIINRRQLRAQEDAVRIGVIQARAVDVLMHDDDTPFRVRMSFDGFLDQRFMVGSVVVVGVDDDEEGIAVGVIVTVAGFRRVTFFREGVRYVEVVLVTGCHAVVVADAAGFGQIAQGCGRKVSGILDFLFVQLDCRLVFRRLVDLVARRDEEVDFRMLREGAIKGLVPVSLGAVCKKKERKMSKRCKEITEKAAAQNLESCNDS